MLGIQSMARRSVEQLRCYHRIQLVHGIALESSRMSLFRSDERAVLLSNASEVPTRQLTVSDVRSRSTSPSRLLKPASRHVDRHPGVEGRLGISEAHNGTNKRWREVERLAKLDIGGLDGDLR